MCWRAALIAVAVAAALLPIPPAFIERWYSTLVYPSIQALTTSASNRAPFALFDTLIAATTLCWLIALGIDIRRQGDDWGRIASRLLLRVVVWVSAFYLVFLAVWGLNYRRTKLVDKLQFAPGAISIAAARMLATTAVDELNALHGRAHGAGWPPVGTIDPSLALAFDGVQAELGVRPKAVVGRPKATLLDVYFRRVGVSGMTDPYFLETLVERNLLPFERPFVLAHEWSHLAGFADESEASFVGWLACLRGSIADRYSGWLFLYSELADAASPSDRAALTGRLGPGPRDDLRAIAQRLQRDVNPTVSAAGWRVYDRYLKANRVEAGVASYSEVLRLVLGVRFGPGWTPLLR